MGAAASTLSSTIKTDIKVTPASEDEADGSNIAKKNGASDKELLAVPQTASNKTKGTTKQPSGTSYGLEEFVDYDKIAVSYGKLGEGGEEHALYKSEFVLLSDKVDDVAQPLSILYKSTDIYITNQLNVQQFIQFASSHQGMTICKISLRMEPVLFIEETPSSQHFIPLHLFSVKQKAAFLPTNGKDTECLWEYELQVRKELSSLTAQLRGLQYYKSSSGEDNSVVTFNMEGDDDLLTLREIDAELSLLPSTSCVRCAFPFKGLPALSAMDELVAAASNKRHSLLLIEDGDISHPRCQFAACVALIVRGYCQEVRLLSKVSSSPFTNHAADALVVLLVNGSLRRYEVDQLLTAITTFTSVSTIQDQLTSLSSCCERDSRRRFGTPSSEEVLTTQMYLMLIVFNYYWHQAPEEKFSSWLNRDCILLSCFIAASNPLLPNITTGLGNSLVLVNNSKNYDDHLCTLEFNNVANLRGIPKLPIYGVCQPTKQGLSSLVSHLKNLKHNHVWLVSVREDPTILCNGEVYCLRDSKRAKNPLSLRQVTGEVVSSLEKDLVGFSSQGDITKIILDETFPESPTLETPSDAYGGVDDVTFLHIPLPLDSGPSVTAVEAIQSTVKNILAAVEGQGKPPAIVFYCDTGKDRTTAGMCIAGLAFCNAKGYAHGAAKGEVERTAIWNGMYTRGEFKIIQKIVSAMPKGHQSKREVDFILDQCFETSSMMHYHVREQIFVTFNKKEKLKAQVESDTDGTATICIRGPNKGTGMELNVRAYYGQLHKQSLDSLERYAMLIIYNHYLKNSNVMRGDDLGPSFSVWLSNVGAKSGLLAMLDGIQFCEFEAACSLRYRLARNCHVPMSQGTVHGP